MLHQPRVLIHGVTELGFARYGRIELGIAVCVGPKDPVERRPLLTLF